jgi:biopolymer transport protein ExbB
LIKNNNHYGPVAFGAGALFFVLISQAIAETTEATSQAGSVAKTFFTQFIIAGGPIVWLILLPMSIATVCLAIELCFTIRAGRLLPSGGGADISERIRRLGLSHLHSSGEKDLVSRALISMAGRYSGSENTATLRSAVSESLQQQGIVLMRKVQWCNIIGNVAPMVGLFGTVFGMIRAFNLLGVSGGQPRPDQLAAAISVALITTFWGLLVAIPALAMHGIFCTKIEDILGRAAFDAEGIIRQIVSSSSRPLAEVQKNKHSQLRPEATKKLFKDPKDRLPIKPIS